MELFRRLFAPRPAPPMLLRVRSAAGAPRSVEVRARWAPSGRTMTSELLTEAGLCLVLWPKDASGVELQLRAGAARGALVVERKDTQAGAVVEVELGEETAAAG